MTGDLGSNDVKVDEEAFFIFDNDRLGGSDAEVICDTSALVLDHHAEREGNAGFNDVGVRVIGKDIALVEIFQSKAGKKISAGIMWENNSRGFERLTSTCIQHPKSYIH